MDSSPGPSDQAGHLPCHPRQMSRNALTIDIRFLVLAVTRHGRQFCNDGNQRTASEALIVLCWKLLRRQKVVAYDKGRSVAIRLCGKEVLAGRLSDVGVGG